MATCRCNRSFALSRSVSVAAATFAAASLALATLVGAACAARTPPRTPATPPVQAAAPAVPAPAALPSPPSPSRAVAPPLTGPTTRGAVESFDEQWKMLRAQDYVPDPSAVATIRDHARDVTVFIVLATWCPDTRRELPRFFKIADLAGWPESRMRLLAVDRSKKDAEGETEKWNVTRVPTFILLRAGKEIGRIVERPTATLEAEIAQILSGR